MQTIEQVRAAHDTSNGSEFVVEGRFVIVNCTTKEGKGGPFAVLELRDPTGSLTARCFEGARLEELAGAGTVDCRLRMSTFNNSISAAIVQFEAVELTGDEVLRYAGLDVEAHAARVQQVKRWIDECDGTVYGDVLREIFAGEGVWEQFCMAPAAVRMHHAEPGGLVRHIHEVALAGLGLLDSAVPSGGAPTYDRAYFLAGVLLHDIGKLDTYTTPPTIAYTAQGQLAEHQIYSTFRLAKACAKVGVPASIEAKLIHIIEQAHGAFRHAEWQDPLGVEVKALAAADFFSSRLGVTEKERRSQDALDQLFSADSHATAAEDLARMGSGTEAGGGAESGGLF